MPIDYYEDLMPRNAPKPAPLVEVQAIPLVPEVSLLLDQDRNKSIHLATKPRIIENKSTNPQKELHKDVPYGNQFESYNTWRAKNAQLLSEITGSSAGLETALRCSDKRENYGSQKDHLNNKEFCQSEEIKYGEPLPETGQLPRVNQVKKKPEQECSNENVVHHPVQNTDQQHINHQNMPVCYTQNVSNYSQPRCRQLIHPPHQYQHPSTFNQTKSCFPNASCKHLPFNKAMQFPNMRVNSYQDLKRQQNTNFPEQFKTLPNDNSNQVNFNQGQCQCENGQCGVTSNNRVEYVNSQPCVPTEERSKGMQTAYEKIPSPLDIAHVNNQAIIDLYHIINLQNEQIFMLQQQVKQVLQLQLHLDCEKSVKQNFICQRCPCVERNNCTSEIASCGNFQKESDIKIKTDINSTNNIPENYEKSKRSIGVMTSSVEKSYETSKIVPKQNENCSSRVKQKKKQHFNSIVTPILHPSNMNQRDVVNAEDRVKKKSTPISRPPKKPNQVESTQVDNSFSLNEAELVIRTNSEQDDLSPNASVHVDLQDYYSSSVESDSEGTASSSNEDERNSESEDGSSDPPLSWTFYNRVVGQVNKILKETPSPPQQERHEMYKIPAHLMYKMNADYETENNWSKRVTFDGPPLEDSDHNMPHLREPHKFNKAVPYQDLKMNDGHGRMQDFMMYNFANGNTNLSFATLRYLDRYHQLPSQKQSKPSEQMYHQKEQRSNKRSTKKKTRNFEKYSDMPPPMSKRKSSTPSSKLLDITALKQQPKLF